MGGPYRAINLKVSIITDTETFAVGQVEGCDVDLGYEGQPETVYGSRNKSHSTGSKKVAFSLSRWFYTDTPNEDLFINLMKNEETFTLRTSLVNGDGIDIPNTTVDVTGCTVFNWKEITGGADDIVGESINGFGEDWSFTGFAPTVPSGANWGLLWNVLIQDYGIGYDYRFQPQKFAVYQETNRVFVMDSNGMEILICSLIDGSFILQPEPQEASADDKQCLSADGRYFVTLATRSTVRYIDTYKDGVLESSIDINDVLGVTTPVYPNVAGYTPMGVSISPDGSYMVISLRGLYGAVDENSMLALFAKT